MQRLWSRLKALGRLSPAPRRGLGTSQECKIGAAQARDAFYKRGANVGLADRYRRVTLSNGVQIYAIDRD